VAVAEAQALGVNIAIDDFGTGYSSLNYLHRLPIDRLKIDRSFIQVLHQPNSTLPILEAIISMAKNMEMGGVGDPPRGTPDRGACGSLARLTLDQHL
jgi:sensor c-di-GMP phosphodiesterase-like protein